MEPVINAYQDYGFDPEFALAYLLTESVIFANSRDFLYDGKPGGHTIVLFVNVNDIFCPAADAEDLDYHEIQALYDAYIKEMDLGVAKWAMKKRGYKPWKRHIERMKERGEWEEWMDLLRDNNI